jgi:SAM-dependent methyltransferase
MEREQYDLMFHQEEGHWWYVGMRRIAEGLLERYFQPGPGRPEILDAGCGSGGTTVWLSRWGRVTALDLMPEAVELARQRGIKRLLQASVEQLPFADASFDLLTSFDVLYHLGVGDDDAALAEFARVLRPGGLALIRVAAHDWLRGAHDRATHTRHRYHRAELTAKLQRAGLAVERESYANCLLFPIAPLKRMIERHDPAGCADLWRPPAPINALLGGLLGLEAGPIARRGLPLGLSVVAVARKPARPGTNAPKPRDVARPMLSSRTSLSS